MAHAYATRNGMRVVQTYSDAAQSGASMFSRDGLQDLMADARNGLFDAVLVESLDRLSRDMEDLAGIHKRLTFAGIKIIALHEGVANTLTVGLRGIIGQMFREDNVHKTKRGMKGKVDQGLIASGAPYGYDQGAEKKGTATINEAQAEVVRRIFADYIAGKSPRTLAADLNADGIPGPRGRLWQGSAIYGWEKRGTGILRNPIYVGKLAWNRTHFVKDPDTGRRRSRPNPPSEWVYGDAPHLRIVDQKTWEAAQALCAGRVTTATEAGAMKRPKHLLSGLLRCGACGGGMSLYGSTARRRRIMCTNHRDGKACPNPKTWALDIITDRVVDTLRGGLADPEVLVEYVTAYNEARQDLARSALKRRHLIEKRIADLDAKIDRIMQLLIKGVGNEARLGDEMNAKEAELLAAKAELAAEPEGPDFVALHPETIARYEAGLLSLRDELEKGMENTPAHAQILGEMVHSITVTPDAKATHGMDIQIQGNLRRLLEGTGSNVLSGGMGAGARFELTTFRL